MYEFHHPEPVTVALRAQSGDVHLFAEDRDTVEVEVTPFDGSDKGREAAQNTRVLIEDDTLLIQVPGADYWNWRRTPKLHIVARVPAGSALAGKTASADVRGIGLFSVVQLEVASADIHLDDVTGDADLSAASGTLDVARVGGSIRAKTASGRVRLGDVAGDVNAESASGDVLVRSAGGSLRAKSASGDIVVGSLRAGQSRIGTASGDVAVGIAPGTGVWLDLSTASGKSTSDLTGQGEVPPTGATLELRVRTASGDIHVHRAETAPQTV